MKKLLLSMMFLVGTAQAATATYTCAPAANNPSGLDSAITLRISATTAKISIEGQDYESSGKLNPKYAPRTNKNMVQFTGFSNYGDYSISVLTEKTLIAGYPAGVLIVRAQWDDFQQGKFICRR